MKIIIEAEPTEIAALVLAVQRRQGESISVEEAASMARESLEQAIRYIG